MPSMSFARWAEGAGDEPCEPTSPRARPAPKVICNHIGGWSEGQQEEKDQQTHDRRGGHQAADRPTNLRRKRLPLHPSCPPISLSSPRRPLSSPIIHPMGVKERVRVASWTITTLLRRGIKTMLETEDIQVVGEASTAPRFWLSWRGFCRTWC